MDTTQILYLAGAFVLGFIIAWFAGRGGPKRAAEEAAAQTESVRRKLTTTESDLRKTQGQMKDNLATLDQLAADKENLVNMLRTSEQGLSEASAEISRLTQALSAARDDRLLLETELGQARGALADARNQMASLTVEVAAATDMVAEVAAAAESAAEIEQMEDEATATRMFALESELAIARATAERLADKEALMSAEIYLRRRTYSDIVAGGEGAIVAALAARDHALASAETQMDYMRRDLSMLTAAGSQLASALEQRDREYGYLLDRVATGEVAALALPATSLASSAPAPAAALAAADTTAQEAVASLNAALDARAAELDELKAEYADLQEALARALADRNDIQSQFEARSAELDALTGKVNAADLERAAWLTEKSELARKLEARVGMVSGLLARIGDFDEQLRAVITAAVPPADNGAAGDNAADATTQEGEGETNAG